MKDKIIKQYGLQRSGTNYIKALLELNYEVVVFSNLYGDKHSKFNITDDFLKTYDPHKDEKVITDLSKDEINHYNSMVKSGCLKFIVIFKDPYSWCFGYNEYNKILNTVNKTAINTDLEDENVIFGYIETWNSFNLNWVQELIEKRANISFGIYYNNFISKKIKVLSEISEKFNLQQKSNKFIDIKNRMLMGSDKYATNNIGSQRFCPKKITLSKKQIAIIDSILNIELFEKIKGL